MISEPIYFHCDTRDRITGTHANPSFNFKLPKPYTHCALIDAQIPKVSVIDSANYFLHTVEDGAASDNTKYLPEGIYSLEDICIVLQEYLNSLSLVLNGGDATEAYQYKVEQENKLPQDIAAVTNYTSQKVNISIVGNQDGTLLDDLLLNVVIVRIYLSQRLANVLGFATPTIILRSNNGYTYSAENIANLNYYSDIYVSASNITSSHYVAGKQSLQNILAVLHTVDTNYGSYKDTEDMPFMYGLTKVGNPNNETWEFKFTDNELALIETYGVPIKFKLTFFDFVGQITAPKN